MGEASTLTAGSPKLLELDKADVQAVRSFLPGKVLGRTAALLALGVLVLGFAGLVDVGLERFLGFPLEPRWLKYALLIGIPVLIVGAQIVAEWQAERKRRQAQALAVKTEAVREGYFCIGPYLDTADDRAKFDRAPSRWGCCHPHPSQTRTCRFPASGSSRESFARGGVDDAVR